jgi:ferredoxin, 2Fe-2S
MESMIALELPTNPIRERRYRLAKITYLQADGAEFAIEVQPGYSVMQGAVQNSVPGILAECGGNCACGTCKIYIAEAWRGKTGLPSDMEEAMLELNEDHHPGKRLSCQIEVTQDLDGLVVTLPESQF